MYDRAVLVPLAFYYRFSSLVDDRAMAQYNVAHGLPPSRVNFINFIKCCSIKIFITYKILKNFS